MPSIKEYNRKLASLKNTVKITKTMKMVSASKLRRAQDNQKHASDYALEVNELIYRVSGGIEDGSHPLMTPRANPKKQLIVLFTSDKGLCAGFNNNLLRFAERHAAAQAEKGTEVSFVCCGRRGNNHFKRRGDIRHFFDEQASASPSPENSIEVADMACADFQSGEYDEVILMYNHFISPLSQKPTIETLLPMTGNDFAPPADAGSLSTEFIAEPSVLKLIDVLIPKLVNFKIFYAMLENAAGEHGARMTAMDNATNNANDLIDTYKLKRNRARQAAITTELIEIISGAEAL